MPPSGPSPFVLLVLLAASCLLIPAQGARAAEAILFDGDNCTGKYRMIDRSVADFDEIEFDNKVNSLMVITGSFRFYRDADFEEDNGPSFLLGPSGYQDTCWSLQDASLGRFPVNRMSSARMEGDTPAPQPKGIAILYEDTNFGGSYRILTRSVSDLARMDFDNEVESIRIISGGWVLYRDADFAESPERPKVPLGPGDYPDIRSLPGLPVDFFPRNLMSSVRLLAL